MKFNKQLAIILVLIAMLLSATAVSVYFYNQNKQIEKTKSSLVTIYVAKKEIKRYQLIQPKDLKETKIQRQYILTKPLLKKEILNKFAKETIYQNEAFLKEKLTTKVVQEVVKKKDINFKYNSYNMPLKLFKNPNYDLQVTDNIDIISVYGKDLSSNKNHKDYSVQYIATNIKVLGFLREGRKTKNSIVKQKIKTIERKKRIEKDIEIKADEIVLDLKRATIVTLIHDYNKGQQLWMIKSKPGNTVKSKKKEIMKLFEQKTPTSYPVTWYTPKDRVKVKKAIISYSDGDKVEETKKMEIKTNFDEICSKTSKLLLATRKMIKLKQSPSHNATELKHNVYKNYVLPYIQFKDGWYKLCDQTFIHEKDIKKISYNKYLQLIGKKNKKIKAMKPIKKVKKIAKQTKLSQAKSIVSQDSDDQRRKARIKKIAKAFRE